ncbi:MAG: hybrid sensor histidine kinase/response regulator [bacterium]|nr:hybrid sensor histidine kinase/response regulator [bacterium]
METNNDTMQMNGTILLIDDDLKIGELCRLSLEYAGYTVIWSKNGKEGLQAAQLYKPDLIVMDIMMPVMGGFETLSKLKATPAFSNIPVLVITARSATEDVVAALENGAQDYIKKPFDIEELLARVATMVKLKKVEDKLKTTISRLEHEAAVGTMATGAAHDFNNILTNLSISNSLEKRVNNIQKNLTPQQQDTLSEDFKNIDFICTKINETVKLGEMLSEAIAQFAKGISAGRLIQPIAPLIDPPLFIYGCKLKSSSIQLKIDIAPDLPQVLCSSGEIQRLLLNLVSNAIDAMLDSKERHLNIRLYRENSFVNLEVADSGAGISDEVRPHIFENYFTTKKKEKGFGIGLAIVKRIMAAHNGQIYVKTTVGQGTTFIMSFPAQPAAERA